jgi:hypothetical protein
MGSGALIDIQNLITIGSDIQKLIWRDSQTYRQRGDGINLVIYFFFQNKVTRLKIPQNIFGRDMFSR